MRSAALGWPVAVFAPGEAAPCLPALIVPATWSIEAAELVIVPEGPPSPNPAFLAAVTRATRWKAGDLLDRLFPEGEPEDLGPVSDRMRLALATIGGAELRPAGLAAVLDLRQDGLANVMAMVLPDDSTFTKGAAEDLEAMRDWSPDAIGGTALAALGGGSAPGAPALPLLPHLALTEAQAEAAEGALARGFTVIHGPPGTGKSQVIVALAVSALLKGRSVLVAARNHQALDEIEQRVGALVGQAPVLVRARDREGERNTGLAEALQDVIALPPRAPPQPGGGSPDRAALMAAGDAMARARARQRARFALDLEISELAERLEPITRHLPDAPGRARRAEAPAGLLGRLRRRLLRLLGRLSRRAADDGPLPEAAPPEAIRRRMEMLRARRRNLEDADPAAEDWARLAREVAARLPRCAEEIAAPAPGEHRALADLAARLVFEKLPSRRMDRAAAEAVLRHRPIWLVPVLSAPARLPLLAGLFDLVVIDEASQADIGAALPVLARGRRAVVVGDPEQLTFVPSLARETEAALMDAAGLPRAGRHRFAQGSVSLFGFAARFAPPDAAAFLPDQFRSHPEIVAYLNEEFYRGRLRARRAEEDFRAPRDVRPGLAWEDVPGQVRQEEGGSCNPDEAARIVGLLARLAADPGFEGSVGVISPFNAQVACIERAARKALDEAARARLGLRIATVDRFQGGEADVILFSPVLAPGAPDSARSFLHRERRRLNVAVSRARALCLVVGDHGFALRSGIPHLAYLARRATETRPVPAGSPFESGWERRLFVAMRARGMDPIPQYPVGFRRLDFALDPEGRRIDVEVDGRRWHEDPDGNRKLPDRLRDRELAARGWNVLRFWVHELEGDMEACLDRIERALGR